jgi:hypothetical protein
MSSPDTLPAATPVEEGRAGRHPLEALREAVQARVRVTDPAEADQSFAELIAQALKLYVGHVTANPESGLPENVLTATETAIACIQLLDSADLEVFELAMWKSWSGGPGGAGPDIGDFNPNSVRTSRSRR